MTLLFADLCAIFTPYRWMIEHVTTKRGQLRIYLGAAPGRGQNLRHARRGAPQAGARHRRGRRGRRDTRTQQDRETARGHRDDPAALRRISGCQVSRTRCGGSTATSSSGGAGGRTRPHQHTWQQEPQALAGRSGNPRRRHHGDLDGQHPALGGPKRCRGANHRHRAEGEDPRRDRPRGRSGRAGRHHTGSVAAQACSRQRLCSRTGRCRAVQLLPHGQSDRAARDRVAVAGRPS